MHSFGMATPLFALHIGRICNQVEYTITDVYLINVRKYGI